MNCLQPLQARRNVGNTPASLGGCTCVIRTWAALVLLGIVFDVSAQNAVIESKAGGFNLLVTDNIWRVYDRGHDLTFVLQQNGSYRIEPSPDDGFWDLHPDERLLSVDGQRASTPRNLLALLGQKKGVVVRLAIGDALLSRRLGNRPLSIFRSLTKAPAPAPPGGLPIPPPPTSMVPNR